jgi:hypothetical protein
MPDRGRIDPDAVAAAGLGSPDGAPTMDRATWTAEDYVRALADVEALAAATDALTAARGAVVLARRRYPDGTPAARLDERARADPVLMEALVAVGHAARRVAELEARLVATGVLPEDARGIPVTGDGSVRQKDRGSERAP